MLAVLLGLVVYRNYSLQAKDQGPTFHRWGWTDTLGMEAVSPDDWDILVEHTIITLYSHNT